jgi:hypothetical protein
MKKLYMLLAAMLIMVMGIGLTGCSSYSKSSEKAITAFSLNGVEGTINKTEKTIAVAMPFGTDLTNLFASFTTTGESVKVGSTVQTSGSTTNNFTSPVTYTVIAFDGTSVIYTVNVKVLYKFVTTWGSLGTEDGQFYNPQGIAVDASGNVYVVDSGNNRIQVLSPQ